MDEDLVEPSGPSESSPLQNEDETSSGPVEYSAQERAALELRQRKQRVRKRPHIAYVLLSGAQLFLGVAILAVGGAAFGTTPSYRAGCFWAGLVSHIVVALCLLSILVTITATVMDTLAAYMLHRTDFSRCLHTDTHIVVDCDSKTCSNLRLPPNTCYCCYLYNGRKSKDCDTPFLLDKMPYFEGVASCSVVRDVLCPLVLVVALLEVLSTILNIIFLFKNRPIRYYEGKKSEQEGEEKGGKGSVVSRFVPNWCPVVKNQRDVKYTAASTVDNSDT